MEHTWKIILVSFILGIFFIPLLQAQEINPANPANEKELFLIEEVDEIVVSKKDSLFNQYDTLIVITNYLIRKKDTLIKKGSPLPLGGVSPVDTIVAKPDTTKISTDTVFTLNERVLDKIEKFSRKDNWLAKLFRNVVIFEDKKVPGNNPAIEEEKTESRYERFEGKIIGNIDIEVLNVLGYSIDDTSKKPRSLLERAGNALHVKTQKNIIRNKLLFSPGSEFLSIKVAESERLIRQTNFIYDAIITPSFRPDSDTVDIFIITQDLWSLTGGGSVDLPSSSLDFSVRDVNFLGLGQRLNNIVKINPILPSGYNYRGEYYINNIYKTQSFGQLYYRYENGEKRYGAGVNREFISSSIVWAGGLNYSRNELYFISPTDSLRKSVGFNAQDVWLGYALQGAVRNKFDGNRIFLTTRLLRTEFFDRPLVRKPNEYISNNFYLGSVGYFHRSFYKDNYIFQLGRTEDIPEGQLFSITSGIQKGENFSRLYMGVLATYSKRSSRFGYIYTSAGIGGFRNSGNWEEGTFFTKFLYYSKLLKIGTWKTRSFLSIRRFDAVRPTSNIVTNVNRENGLRGLNSALLYGTRKLVINFENDFFPNINFLGFRFGLMFFADIAWIGNDAFLVRKGNFQHGYGVGIRFRNENLIFSMVQLLIGYYPNAPAIDKPSLQMFERTRYFYNFNDFEFTRPSVSPIY